MFNSQYGVKKDRKALSSYYLESRSRPEQAYDLREGALELWKSSPIDTSLSGDSTEVKS